MSPRKGDDRRPAEGQALASLLDLPQLAKVVPYLAPAVLHRLIRHAGLERCVDLVEAATGDQLRAILDLDLWGSSQAGHDELFDAERFGGGSRPWSTGMQRRVVADSICHRRTGLRFVRVLDPGVLEPTASTDDEWRWAPLRTT
jgi:hypothetical protein